MHAYLRYKDEDGFSLETESSEGTSILTHYNLDCIACGLCEPVCPVDAIFIRDQYIGFPGEPPIYHGSDFMMRLDECIVCGDCANACPTTSLSFKFIPRPGGSGGTPAGPNNPKKKIKTIHEVIMPDVEPLDDEDYELGGVAVTSTKGTNSTAVPVPIKIKPSYVEITRDGDTGFIELVEHHDLVPDPVETYYIASNGLKATRKVILEDQLHWHVMLNATTVQIYWRCMVIKRYTWSGVTEGVVRVSSYSYSQIF